MFPFIYHFSDQKQGVSGWRFRHHLLRQRMLRRHGATHQPRQGVPGPPVPVQGPGDAIWDISQLI